MSESRTYVSPKREAQAAATRTSILEAFAEQLSESGRETLSPRDAAARAGVSVRTVHTHFPDREAQIAGLAAWLDERIFPDGFVIADGPDDLARYFRDIHRLALSNPVSRMLSIALVRWPEVRQARRVERLDAIRKAVKAIGSLAE